ncbi:MAG: glycosyltransferase family 4 protein, partial [Micrococcales bacterium]|nr:glycosyltransferase family 4 protein [Micrococcales bacterium]
GPLAACPAWLLRTCTPRQSAPWTVGCWLAGWRDEARAGIAAQTQHGRLGRVAAEVAIELDVLDPGVRVAPATAARAAWRRGDLAQAVAAAPAGSALHGRLADELSLLADDAAITHRRVARASRTVGTVLHLLVNSVPTTASGYTVRSHEVLRAQRRAGIDAVAATRLGYPVNVGLITGRDLDVVDDVPYHRLVGWSAPRRARQRAEQHVVAATDLALRCGVRRGTGVVHATTPFTNALVAAQVAARLGVPWVYEVRGLLEETWAASFPTAAAREAARGSQRHALARARETQLALAADHVVVLGTTVRDCLVARGVSPEQIAVVPNGVDEALLACDTDPAAARVQLGLPAAGFWVGTVGSLVDYEGVGTVLEAVARLRAGGADVRVAVVGDGVARPSLLRQVQALALGDAAVLPGRVSPTQVATWYQSLDVFVVPRRDTAVTRTVVPLKPMQAMALRRPVVASDLPALREVVGDPGAGLLVAPQDADALAQALTRLADDRDLAASLGSAGRQFAATRTWARVGQMYRELYAGLCVAGAREGLAA